MGDRQLGTEWTIADRHKYSEGQPQQPLQASNSVAAAGIRLGMQLGVPEAVQGWHRPNNADILRPDCVCRSLRT